MTYIYYAYIKKERHSQLLKQFSQEFPRDYQNRILNYKRWQDAQLSILGRLLLRYGLNKIDENYPQNEILFNLNSKPYFKKKNINFNISHSASISICAISNICELGIDIEIIKEIDVMDFKNIMTKNEWIKISNADDTKSSFFDYWTQKEAVLKAHGSGMSIPLKSFENVANHTSINHKDFFLKEIKLGIDYKCYLAFNGEIDTETIAPMEIDSLRLF